MVNPFRSTFPSLFPFGRLPPLFGLLELLYSFQVFPQFCLISRLLFVLHSKGLPLDFSPFFRIPSPSTLASNNPSVFTPFPFPFVFLFYFSFRFLPSGKSSLPPFFSLLPLSLFKSSESLAPQTKLIDFSCPPFLLNLFSVPPPISQFAQLSLSLSTSLFSPMFLKGPDLFSGTRLPYDLQRPFLV